MISELTLRLAMWRLRKAQQADAKARLARDVERRKQQQSNYPKRRLSGLKSWETRKSRKVEA
jgi:hypothetical protein